MKAIGFDEEFEDTDDSDATLEQDNQDEEIVNRIRTD
jgi:hypothetical protein